MQNRRFSVNGTGEGGGKEDSLLDRNRKALAAVSPVLDQINQKFSEAEKKLKAFQPSENASFSYDSEPADLYRPDAWKIHYCVGFVLHNGQWRICHGSYHDGVNEQGPDNWQPITEAPRRVRVKVASRFPKLYHRLQEEIVKATEVFGPEAEKALEKMIVALG
jgi:hypothetical protein